MKKPSQILSDNMIPDQEETHPNQGQIPTEDRFPEITLEERVTNLEKQVKKLKGIPQDVKKIKEIFETFLKLFKDGDLPKHICIQSQEVAELKDELKDVRKELKEDRTEFYEVLGARDEKIYEAFKAVEVNQEGFKERLKKKKQHDETQNGQLRDDAKDIDDLQVDVAILKTDVDNTKMYQKIILTAIIVMLLGFLAFIIEFNYKTFFMHI